MGQRAGDDGAEIVEQSGRYALIRDAEGVAIYDLDLGSDADPVASYPPGDEPFEAAWEQYGRLVRATRRGRSRLVRVLCIAVVVAAAVWVTTGLAYGLLTLGIDPNHFFEARWFQWLQAADSVAYHVLLGALATLAALWLRARLGTEPAASAPQHPAEAGRGSGPAAP